MTEQSNVLGNSQASERRWPQMNEWMTELASLVCFPNKTINQHVRVGDTWGMISRLSSNLCSNIYSTYRDHSSFFRQKMLTFSKFLDFVHSFLHFIYWDRVSVHGPGYPVIHYVASMELKRSVCPFQVLGLKACTTLLKHVCILSVTHLKSGYFPSFLEVDCQQRSNA